MGVKWAPRGALNVKPNKQVAYRKDSWRATQSLEKNFAKILTDKLINKIYMSYGTSAIFWGTYKLYT